MSKARPYTTAVYLFALVLYVSAWTETANGMNARSIAVSASSSAYSNSWFRTELYFGRSIPGGGSVSEAEWETFLADIVTPRFPDGFTIVKAVGQYREKSGKLDKEPSEILIFVYPQKQRTTSRRKIEEIRRAYVSQFKQESVLRLDFRNPVEVRF